MIIHLTVVIAMDSEIASADWAEDELRWVFDVVCPIVTDEAEDIFVAGVAVSLTSLTSLDHTLRASLLCQS